MSSKRFTITDLRATLAELNASLAEQGFSVRMEEGGRNGYQAVDEFSVHPDGSRNGSGVNRNIACGSSRECAQAARAHYFGLVSRANREALKRLTSASAVS